MRAIAVRVAQNNFKLPADNEVCRNSTTIGSMLFQWLDRAAAAAATFSAASKSPGATPRVFCVDDESTSNGWMN